MASDHPPATEVSIRHSPRLGLVLGFFRFLPFGLLLAGIPFLKLSPHSIVLLVVGVSLVIFMVGVSFVLSSLPSRQLSAYQTLRQERIRLGSNLLLLWTANILMMTFYALAVCTELRGARGQREILSIGSAFSAGLAIVLIALYLWLKPRAFSSDGTVLPDDAVDGYSEVDPHWKWGFIYWNREDPEIFVERRYGWGGTLNLARPGAWMLIVLLLVIVLIPLALIYFAQHARFH